MSSRRPLIAITCGTGRKSPGRLELYTRAVERAGGDTVILRPFERNGDFFAEVGGLLIPGGGDLDPVSYGEAPIFRIDPEEKERVDYELTLIHEVMDLKKPILGICYGMQLINVFLGGSLFQDIASQSEGMVDHSKGTHGIVVSDNPVIPRGDYEVNSSHHQAVRVPGQGVRPVALAADGVIEGFVVNGRRFLAGLQWHPERMDSPLTEMIFGAFIRECRVGR